MAWTLASESMGATLGAMPEAETLTPSPASILSAVPTPGAAPDPQLEAPPTGQLLLGTDKRNPVFAVYEDDSGERLLVFYGFELLEIVKNDAEDPAFKLLLARLYNARVKLSALCESFQVDPKTIRRWGKALCQGDAAELVRVLEGRAAGRKRTLAVESFARLRWPDLIAQRSYGAVERLLGEIQSVFGVKLSRSAIKDLIRELKVGTSAAITESSVPGANNVEPTPSEMRETDVKSLEHPSTEPPP